MVQRVHRQICEVDQNANITIATSKSQVSLIHNQLGDNVGISVEPCRRDTFPAIALVCTYLHDMKGIDPRDSVVICPVDPYVETKYFKALNQLGKYVKTSKANIVLMGIEPTYPSEKYGYIIPEGDKPISRVSKFKEKPNSKMAEEYISQGALWNGGVFAFKLDYIIKKAHELIDFKDYRDLYEKYETLQKISFDYAVVEKEKNIEVMRFAGEWKDLGTWNTLTEAMEDTNVGKAILDNTCENVHVVNELDVPILCMGLKNIVVSASPEGILVTDKMQSGYIKKYVDEINQQVMFAEKSWGSFRVLDVGRESITIKIILKQGRCMQYHSHEHRDEIWNVINGTGIAIIDGEKKLVKKGDNILIPVGCKHTIQAETELQIIEIQIGQNIDVHDKQKFSLEI